jgi:uncharacterized protein (TIGR03435 family)
MNSWRSVVLAAVVCVAVPPAMVAQGVKTQAFAVASIRRNVSGVGLCDADHLKTAADGFRMTNCPLFAAMLMAYVPAEGGALGFSTDGRVVGAPEWMRSEKYDIVARIDEADMAAWQDPAKQKEMLHAMMQSLLAERCRMEAHREKREKPEYALVVAKGGPKLQVAKSVAAAAIVGEHPGAGAVPGGGGMVVFGTGGSMQLYGASVETLAIVLSNMAGRPVVDKTGLTGRYDIKLDMLPQGPPAADGSQDGGPSIFTVVREQLGLRLEAMKGAVETLVIDRVERPTEN